MARTRRLAILAATVLVLGGCGGSSATPTASALATPTAPALATPTASAAATPAPTPSPAPTASPSSSPSFSTAAAASQLTQISGSAKLAVAQCNADKAGAATSLSKAKAAAQECLTAYSQYVADFVAVDWGPAQPQADKVIDAINGIVTLVRQMANATSAASFKVYYDQLPAATASLLTAANALRAALGMPPANT